MKKQLLQPATIDKRRLQDLQHILPEKEPRLPAQVRIPVCEPDITAKEVRYVLKAVKSGWVSSAGSFVEKFEAAFAKTVSQTKYAVAVNSGTSALHVALAALGIKAGDEVITPTFTMIATANAVSYTGATPILVDADPTTWNLDVKKIEAKITPKTKAIIAVHVYGLPCDMAAIQQLARRYNLWVIEDAAEAQGAEYRGYRVGSIGDVAAFSLYANKTVMTGEGGMLTTNSSTIAERARSLREHAIDTHHHFWHRYLGFGYRMTNLQAALGLAQTERFEKLLKSRTNNAQRYMELLSGIDGLAFPVEPQGTKNVYWMFGLLIDKRRFGMSRDELREALARQGIETRTFFIPIHLQPIYHRQYANQRYPISERLCRDGLYLPSFSRLTKDEIAFICQLIRRASQGS